MHETSVSNPILKVMSAFGAAIGVETWSEAAQFVAFCYTLILIAEWIYKHVRQRRAAR